MNTIHKVKFAPVLFAFSTVPTWELWVPVDDGLRIVNGAILLLLERREEWRAGEAD